MKFNSKTFTINSRYDIITMFKTKEVKKFEPNIKCRTTKKRSKAKS